MDWSLFLDDERYPPNDTLEANWKIARSADDAMYYIRTYGLPIYMSLDHDMGFMNMTGMDFCKVLCKYLMDNDRSVPEYYVHSQNPVGAENMRKYLAKYSELHTV